MMHSKGYILLIVLLGIISFSAFADSQSGRADSALESNKGTSEKKNADSARADNDDADSEEDYPPFGKPYKQYRGRRLRIKLQDSTSTEQFLRLILGLGLLQSNSNPNLQTMPAVPAVPSNLWEAVPSTCHTLIDDTYPIFSDMCGAVPQARYGLPNTFGHNDRGVLSHILTTLMSASTDQTCTRSLRNLLCPMLFQPCRRSYEPTLILPCQAFCQAVKAQCGSPALDVIPCDILPYTSDLCPVNQPLHQVPPQPTLPSVPQPMVVNPTPSPDPQTARAYTSSAGQQNVQAKLPPAGMQADMPSRAALEDLRKASKYIPPDVVVVNAKPASEAEKRS